MSDVSDDPTPRAERILRTFLQESTLWPVTFAALAIFVTLGAWLFVLALQDRYLPAMVALAALAGVSAHALAPAVAARRLGAAGWLVIALWGGSLLAALAAQRWLPAL